MDSSFELHMDKLFFPKNNVPKYMCIIDLPGFRNSSYRKDMSTSTIKNEKSFLRFSTYSDKETEKNFLVVTGEKVNQTLQIIETEDKKKKKGIIKNEE